MASISQNYNPHFDGNALTTNSFTCEAPASVPASARNLTAWLTQGAFDDYGSVGGWSSPTTYGVINQFSGAPIQVGSGRSVGGTVTNSIRGGCSCSVTIEWRWDENQQPYDCINGECKLASSYGTPGLFDSYDQCQAKCSLNNNSCDGQCITNEEYSQIQAAIAQKQRDCG